MRIEKILLFMTLLLVLFPLMGFGQSAPTRLMEEANQAFRNADIHVHPVNKTPVHIHTPAPQTIRTIENAFQENAAGKAMREAAENQRLMNEEARNRTLQQARERTQAEALRQAEDAQRQRTAREIAQKEQNDIFARAKQEREAALTAKNAQETTAINKSKAAQEEAQRIARDQEIKIANDNAIAQKKVDDAKIIENQRLDKERQIKQKIDSDAYAEKQRQEQKTWQERKAVNDNFIQERKNVTPNAQQAENLKRFQKKIPSNSKNNVELRKLPNNGVAAQATSPGKVPGSKAVYEKQIDLNGNTVQSTKTTYDPQGNIVHVKDKLNGITFK